MDFKKIMQGVNDWVNSAIEFLKQLPQLFMALPLDEQISWGAVSLGVLLLITGAVLW